MYGLTPRMAACLRAIERIVAETGAPPSYREIADALGLASVTGARRLVESLRERGYVERIPGGKRNIEILPK